MQTIKYVSEEKKNNYRHYQDDLIYRRTALRSLPIFVGLGTDHSCNLTCIMCINRLTDKIKRSPIEEKYLIKFADQTFPTARILQLNTAGEPLMSKRLDLELELAERYGVRIDLITNGTLLNAKKGRLDTLVRNAFSVQFSFDSPFRKTYESIRIGADFSEVVENMRLFQKFRLGLPPAERPVFNIGMVIMKRNLHDLAQMIRFTKDMRADRLLVSYMIPHTNAMEHEALDVTGEEPNKILRDAMALAEKLNVTLCLPVSYWAAGGQVQQKKTFKYCYFLWERAYLDNNGDIFPCCEPSHPVAGSIKDTDFGEIWNGGVYRSMRASFSGGPPHTLCGTCITSGYLARCGF
ncbi:MAG: radical SAM protein [Candidatus Omnitrophica bacterium]|nr:radical SAM protein [Candidatus Omnitrophota bacterium]